MKYLMNMPKPNKFPAEHQYFNVYSDEIYQKLLQSQQQEYYHNDVFK